MIYQAPRYQAPLAAYAFRSYEPECPDCGGTEILWEPTHFPEDYRGDIYGECLCGLPIRQTDLGRYEWLR